MCISPSLLLDGSLVACRKCWQCKANRVNDWVGRNIAESETALAVNSITLTYGRDEFNNVSHPRAAVLTYSDVQKYIRALRDDGYPCRYFAVGEYGSAKGRAHWHALLYWTGRDDKGRLRVPKHVLAPPKADQEPDDNFRFMEKHWPHGWSYWEDGKSEGAVRYVCKYIQKDIGKDERQAHLSMSKKPPLGSQYFVDLAGRYVKQGVAPLEPYYWFSHVRTDDGKPLKFYMSGKTLDNFCQSFIDQWESVHGGHPPTSTLLEAYADRQLESRQWRNETTAEKELARLKAIIRSGPDLYIRGRDGTTSGKRRGR